MEQKKLAIIISFIISFLYNTVISQACIFCEDAEIYRIALFKAEIKGMQAFSPFYYSGYYLNSFTIDPAREDGFRNSSDWQKFLGKDVEIRDIHLILDKTAPELFLYAYENQKLIEIFGGNTFIEKILNPEYKDILEYLVFAKENELNNQLSPENWWSDDDSQQNLSTNSKQRLQQIAEKQLQNTRNNFLKLRYAYHLIRILHTDGFYNECIEVYRKNFNSDLIQNQVEVYALLHYALSLDNIGKALEANLLYAKVFDKSDSRKIRAFYSFNNTPEMLQKTLNLANSVDDKAAIHAIAAFKNPGRALDQLKEIKKISQSSKFLAPLIRREINKLEDWILTPQMTSRCPSVGQERFFTKDDDFDHIRKKNYESDTKYVLQVIEFLKEIKSNSADFHKFVQISIGHLYLLINKNRDAASYFSMFDPKEMDNLSMQLLIDRLILAIETEDLNNSVVKNKVVKDITFIEKNIDKSPEMIKILYSVTLKFSINLFKINKIAEAGLVKMKAEKYKGLTDNEMYQYINQGYYWHLAYFDRFATIKDMDDLINLLKKSNKSEYERFITNQSLPAINDCYDLQGTIAFRNNDLPAALKAFSKVPPNFWETTYSFADYLNENPFIPLFLTSNRTFDYKFNKKQFVETLIQLNAEAEKDVQKKFDNYLLLGHAWFNCSYWGNSWMMSNFGWSREPRYDSDLNWYNATFGSLFDSQSAFYKDYYLCSRSADYYKKAFKNAQTNEQKATATFYLHACDLHAYYSKRKMQEWGENELEFKPLFLKDFYTKYRNTKAFTEFSCPTMDYYTDKFGYIKN